MFKWTSFYNFLEFHSKILNSFAIYRCKKMVKISNCYLYAKKSYGTLSKGAIFFWPTLYIACFGRGEIVFYSFRNFSFYDFELTNKQE